MANEVYVSAQGDTLQTSVLAKELELMLHQLPFMRRLCAYRGSTAGSGSSAIKVGQVDPDDTAESVNEGSAVSANTAITDTSYTLTPGRIAIKRVLSDLLAGVDSTGLMAEAALAAWNHNAIMRKIDALVCTAMASLTGTAGTSGSPATRDDWFTATQTLRTRRVKGKKAGVFHPHQFNNLQTDLLGENGPLMMVQKVQELVAGTYGDNYQTTIGDVDVWISDQVADANGGADHGGAIFQIPSDSQIEQDGFYRGDAAIAIATGSPAPFTLDAGRITHPGDGLVYTDIKGDADYAQASIVTNMFVAVGVALAGRGIKVITDHN